MDSGTGTEAPLQDWGSGPAAVDNCLTVCDDYDIQVRLASLPFRT